MKEIELVNVEIKVGKETKEIVDAVVHIVNEIRSGKELMEIATSSLPKLQLAIEGVDKLSDEQKKEMISEHTAYLVDQAMDILGY